ncbi:MAG: hypothetical protein IKV47_04280, partial [Oscillospiraceae bacterium]|nr:hypothetical protein [Oscillospiraceae bacterium]
MTKKKNTFLRALVIYCVVLAVIFAAALIVLRQFLVSYEASRPDNTVIAFMEEKDLQFWLDGADSVIKSGFNEFSDLSAGVEDFGLNPNAELNWRSAVGGSDSVQYYDVRLGTSRFCRMTLTPGEDVGFGFKEWEVTALEFSPGNDTTITVHVPAGATATINGVEISSDYLNGNGTIGVALSHSFDQLPVSDVYVVEGMRGPIDLK